MLAPNLADISAQPCTSHSLLSLEAKLFVESVAVDHLSGDAAQQVVAECLGSEELALALDHARNILKTSDDYFKSSDHLALAEEVQRNRGAV